MRPLSVLAACVALAPLAALPAMSQGSTQPSQPKEMSSPMTVPDQKLDAAANAIQHVESIREDYSHRLNAAQPEDRARLAQEGQQAMAKAVTDQGLSVDEYNSIVLNAKKDPALRERLVQRLGPPPSTTK